MFPGTLLVLFSAFGCERAAELTDPPTERSLSSMEADADTLDREHPDLIEDEDEDEGYAPRQGERRTIHEEFAEMAELVPGGFGGLYYDEEGDLRIILRRPELANAARAALENIPDVQQRVVKRGVEAVGLGRAQVVRGSYDYRQLRDWFHTMKSTIVLDGVVGVAVRVPDNRINILVLPSASEDAILQHAADQGVPAGAIQFEAVSGLTTASLRGPVKPRAGGAQIIMEHSGNDASCTLGPNVRTSTGQRGFLMNSHCTQEFGVVHQTRVWQHRRYWRLPGQRQIGNEIRDPSVMHSGCPTLHGRHNPHGCRYSDAAVAGYFGHIDDDYGRIVRTTGRNNLSTSISSSNSRFTITGHERYPWPGQVVEKVGRTTGWSGGVVQYPLDDGRPTTEICGAYASKVREPSGAWSFDSPTILCSVRVAAFADGGDSGSPVFELDGTNGGVRLHGMLWGAITYPDGTRDFLYSPLGEIEWELGSLSYRPSGGGGGGGGGEPCEPEPGQIECEV